MNNRVPVLAAASAVQETENAAWPDRKLAVLAFEQALLSYPDPEDADLIRELAPLFPKLARAYESFETELEVTFVDSFLSSDRSLREYELFHRFETLVSNEVEHSRLKAGDEVAMIGSGPLPITAILLAAAFGIRVTAIERKRLAAATSKEVIKKLKLDGEIKVQFGEGESVVSESASCVLIAVLAQPKESILSNVFRRYMRCATVICRTSYGIRQALYAPTDPSAMKQYTIISQNVAHGNQTISSIVLGKPLISR